MLGFDGQFLSGFGNFLVGFAFRGLNFEIEGIDVRVRRKGVLLHVYADFAF